MADLFQVSLRDSAQRAARDAQARIGCSRLVLVAWEPHKTPIVVSVGRNPPEGDEEARKAVSYIRAAMIEYSAEEE